MGSLITALQENDRWCLRFNILWFSLCGVWLANPVFFFMGMYLLTEYVILTEYMLPEGIV